MTIRAALQARSRKPKTNVSKHDRLAVAGSELAHSNHMLVSCKFVVAQQSWIGQLHLEVARLPPGNSVE